MKRYLLNELKDILGKKIILISGPRQTGKTTLSKSLTENFEYLNFDRLADKKKIINTEWNREVKLIIFDEIHKMKKWKQWLKGIYDTEKNRNIIVTGSARLDTHKKVGDSLAGRYFQYRLMPLCLKELSSQNYQNPIKNLSELLVLSGFPEPFLNQSEKFYKKWRRTHLDIILRQDILSTESIKRIQDLELLIELMTSRVGSTISYNSLKEDLSTDDKTIKRWLTICENSYILFKITPYHKNILHSIKKAPKYFFYDYPRVENPGHRLENFVALSLLKEIYFQNDTEGEDYSLHFLRDKDGNEIDFIVTKNKIPIMAIEVKMSETNISHEFKKLTKQLKKFHPKIECIQLIQELSRDFSTADGYKVLNMANFLSKPNFIKDRNN